MSMRWNSRCGLLNGMAENPVQGCGMVAAWGAKVKLAEY
jgi:hypothetical protein